MKPCLDAVLEDLSYEFHYFDRKYSGLPDDLARRKLMLGYAARKLAFGSGADLRKAQDILSFAGADGLSAVIASVPAGASGYSRAFISSGMGDGMSGVAVGGLRMLYDGDLSCSEGFVSGRRLDPVFARRFAEDILVSDPGAALRNIDFCDCRYSGLLRKMFAGRKFHVKKGGILEFYVPRDRFVEDSWLLGGKEVKSWEYYLDLSSVFGDILKSKADKVGVFISSLGFLPEDTSRFAVVGCEGLKGSSLYYHAVPAGFLEKVSADSLAAIYLANQCIDEEVSADIASVESAELARLRSQLPVVGSHVGFGYDHKLFKQMLKEIRQRTGDALIGEDYAGAERMLAGAEFLLRLSVVPDKRVYQKAVSDLGSLIGSCKDEVSSRREKACLLHSELRSLQDEVMAVDVRPAFDKVKDAVFGDLACHKDDIDYLSENVLKLSPELKVLHDFNLKRSGYARKAFDNLDLVALPSYALHDKVPQTNKFLPAYCLLFPSFKDSCEINKVVDAKDAPFFDKLRMFLYEELRVEGRSIDVADILKNMHYYDSFTAFCYSDGDPAGYIWFKHEDDPYVVKGKRDARCTLENAVVPLAALSSPVVDISKSKSFRLALSGYFASKGFKSYIVASSGDVPGGVEIQNSYNDSKLFLMPLVREHSQNVKLVRVSELSQFYRSKLRPENIISRSSVFDTPFEQMSCAVRPDLGGDYVMMPK